MSQPVSEARRKLRGLRLCDEKTAALGTQAAFGVAYHPQALDLRVRNKHSTVRAEVTARARPFACSGCRVSFRSPRPLLLAVNLRKGHGPGRMRQAELELADLDVVPCAELGSRQAAQVGLRGDGMARREVEHLLAAEHEQAVLRFDRGMPQHQVIVLAASGANCRPAIFKIDGAEDSRMVNQLKHVALLRSGVPQAGLGLRRSRPAHTS